MTQAVLRNERALSLCTRHVSLATAKNDDVEALDELDLHWA